MKKLFILLLLPAILFSCKKKNNCGEVTDTAPASEVATLKDYINTFGITATEDSRGFFYSIINAGGSDKPTICNEVKVNYVGRLTNGSVFDQGSGTSFFLSNLIKGWQEGIPLIGAGGKIILYIPPSLAYGGSVAGSIPANSNLIFEIELLGF
ncbi:MAG: FKBP-type peptidyl-prolyl cis-trans isomerase [Chitinophagaceae bacterium]